MTKPGRDYMPADIRDEFEERAAICEFCAGMNRDDADRRALEEVCKRYGLQSTTVRTSIT